MSVLRRFVGLSFVAAFLFAVGFRSDAQGLAPVALAPASPSASVQLAAARQVAAETSKNILVEFGASWCGWCRHFDTLVESPDAGALMKQHFVVLKLTVQESPDKRTMNTLGAQAMMDEWDGGQSGLPFFVFVSAAGEKIADSNAMPGGGNIGYPTTPKEVQAFIRLLGKAAPRMTADDLATIGQYFSKR